MINKVLISVFFAHKKYFRSFIKIKVTDVTWTILTMSLLPFWDLYVVVVLLSMQGQKALRFHQKHLNLCSKDEWGSYGFGTTWGWVINDSIFIFGWTIPLNFSVVPNMNNSMASEDLEYALLLKSLESVRFLLFLMTLMLTEAAFI